MSQKLYRKRGTAQIWVLEKFLKKEGMEKHQCLTWRKACVLQFWRATKLGNRLQAYLDRYIQHNYEPNKTWYKTEPAQGLNKD